MSFLAPRAPRVLRLTAVAAVGMIALSACSSGSGDASSSSSASASSSASGKATVFAAASLKEAGKELQEDFQKKNPGTQIDFNYAGSSKLVQQIGQGAGADLFVSADQNNMDKAAKLAEFSDTKDSQKVIATNTLQLVTAPGNPAHISSINDIADDKIAVCAPEVPCGTLAKEALDKAHVTLKTATQEDNVSSVATKISQSAVDAGFVYSTDALSLQKKSTSGEVKAIDLQGIEKNKYPMALTNAGEKNETAKKFADYLTSSDAQKILAKYGFGSGQ